MKQEFTHLHLHTSYSLSTSTIDIDALIKTAKKNKVTSLAMTDTLNLFAVIKFYQKCIDNKIKPIIGCEIPVSGISEHHDKPNIILLCKNLSGYKNLIKLISETHIMKRSSESAGLTLDLLRKYNSGLILLTGGRNGIFGKNFSEKDESEIFLKNIINIFESRIYIEIDRTSRELEDVYNNRHLLLADKYKLPVVATNDVLFLAKNDFESHEIKVCINKKIKLEERQNQKDFTQDQYFKSESEFKNLFKDLPDAVQNVSEIIKRCNFHLDIDTYHLPAFNTPDETSVDDYFNKIVDEGLNSILQADSSLNKEIYKKRINDESSVIKKMGFASYFLIVHEFIFWAKANSIPVGPGRGSGAGSLVAYALNITSVDPIEHNLLFERFLNPERISMPDFDIDFCMVNRQRIIEHITDLYGENKVSQIITYGTLSARAVIRDVGRVLGMAYSYVDRIAKLIPFTLGITIDEALKQNKELKKEFDNNEEIKNLVELSKKLEGLPRNVGKHAAGIVVAPTNITNYIPLYRIEESDELIAQYDKDDIEKLGLVKFDILGLRTLSIIDRCVKDILNNNKDFDFNNIALDDHKVFELLQKKLTSGVFQLESSGMKRYMGRLKPDCFDDIVALVALYRPGPLGTNMVDDFIENKHGKKIDYEHELLMPILAPTYGLILYQEQVMEISRSLGDYSLGEADLLRRAMGKKKKKEMELHREKFISGASNKKISQVVASSIFSKMEKFAGYGFNKSHSVAYAYISYQTAYLKTYYSSQFLAAALSSDMDNTDKVISLVDASKEMNIKILKPDINASDFAFLSIDKTTILFGLGAIKGVGSNAVSQIIKERNKNGHYQNIFDFCERVSLSVTNIGTIDSLIYSGAFDVFETDRKLLKDSVEQAMSYGHQKQNIASSGQQQLFDNDASSFVTNEKPSISNNEKASEDTTEKRLKLLSLEKKVIGFYLSGHPMEEYNTEINSMAINKISYYFDKLFSGTISAGSPENATISGVILNIRSQRIGQDKFINIITVDDSSARIDVVVYSDVYLKYQNIIKENEILFFGGIISIDEFNSSLSLKASKIFNIEDARQKYSKEIQLLLNGNLSDDKFLQRIIEILEPHRNGKCPLTIRCISNGHIIPFNLDNKWFINPTSSLINNLKDLLGKENIIVKYQ